MTQKKHALIHKENIKKLNTYSKTKEGRKNSKENLKRLWGNGTLNSSLYEDMWKNTSIREKRVDSLTFKTDTQFIKHALRAINQLGGPFHYANTNCSGRIQREGVHTFLL